MATPSSSGTSPSPPIAFLNHALVNPSHQPTAPHDTPNAQERENRKKAVQKFLARAEIAMVTRALRARLAYASYKATHNIPHIPLRDLEAQSHSHSQTASFNRTIAAKRKAAGGNYYNNPATQGSTSTAHTTATQRRGGGAMPPPTSTSSPRISHALASSSSSNLPNASTPGYASYNEVASSMRPAGSSAPVNLYSSILAPPPAKHARTIHNPSDPPVAAPSRPTPSPRTRTRKVSTPKATAGKGKASTSAPAASSTIATGKAAKTPASPRQRRTKGGAASIDKGKRRQRTAQGEDAATPTPDNTSTDIDVDAIDMDGDVDMKAAATLTSLLMHHHRPSMGSIGSPRSSVDGGGSEGGLAYSYGHGHVRAHSHSGVGQPHSQLAQSHSHVQSHSQHFAQSSARGTSGGPGGGGGGSSSSNLAPDPMFLRTHTPPPHPSSRQHLSTTPRAGGGSPRTHINNASTTGNSGPAAPTDSEAANLMLFLATSPSPVRPAAGGANGRDAKDMAAYRALGGGSGPLRAKGRVLFPAAGAGDGSPNRHPPLGVGLRRGVGGEDSFASSVSSIGSAMDVDASGTQQAQGGLLLPPAPLPVQDGGEFNFHDFLHASPSPGSGLAGSFEAVAMPGPITAATGAALAAAPTTTGNGTSATSTTAATQHKNLGLRADVGRKLFAEEQMRQRDAQAAVAAGADVRLEEKEEEEERQEGELNAEMREAETGATGRTLLGAGIELKQQS